MKNDEILAFPQSEGEKSARGVYTGGVIFHKGMTLRDFFAAQALHGAINFIPAKPAGGKYLEEVATGAYRIADALMAERAKNAAPSADGGTTTAKSAAQDGALEK